MDGAMGKISRKEAQEAQEGGDGSELQGFLQEALLFGISNL
jgi:hypothetical protein